MRTAVLHTLNNPEYYTHLQQGSYEDLQSLTWDQAAAKIREVYAHVLTSLQPAHLAVQPAYA
jgi:hypothetical protein